MIGIIILFTHISQAAFTIKPIDDDHSFFLIKDHQEKIINPSIKNDSICIKNKNCNYSINDFRHEKKMDVGCAVNINRKKSSINGDICS